MPRVVPVRATCAICSEETTQPVPGAPIETTATLWVHRGPDTSGHKDCERCDQLIQAVQQKVAYYCPRCIPLRYAILSRFLAFNRERNAQILYRAVPVFVFKRRQLEIEPLPSWRR